MRARVFLGFTIVGFLMPPVMITIYCIDQGAFDIVDMLNAMVDNTIALAVFLDVTLSSLCFFYWASYEGPRLGIDRWWWCIPATVVIGLCFALPLFMYWRERALELETTAID
jgi:hypothetical protein